MADAGWIKLWRGWRDNPILYKGERALAWLWLLENAAWRPIRVRIKGHTVILERGQLSFSQRFLAGQWGWSKSAVDRFMADLREEGMIATHPKAGAVDGENSRQRKRHPAGQGQAIITICDYEKYQGFDGVPRGNSEARTRATAGQRRGKEEQEKKGRRKEIAEAISPRGSDPAAMPAPVETSFETFWKIYPLRVGKEAARKAWAKAIKQGVDPTHLIGAARRYAAHPHEDPRYIPHPSTWLNAGRYDDEDQSHEQQLQRHGRANRIARARHPAARLLDDLPGGFFAAEAESASCT
jgi:hypothetical protein